MFDPKFKKNVSSLGLPLHLLIFVLVFLNPLFYFLDFVIFPEVFGAQSEDLIGLFSGIIIVGLFSILSFVLGFLILLKNQKAIPLAKEYFVFLMFWYSIILIIFSISLFSSPKGWDIYVFFSSLLGLIVFTALFFYLVKSKKVRKLFKKTKINYLRLFAVWIIPSFILFLILILFYIVLVPYDDVALGETGEIKYTNEVLKRDQYLYYSFGFIQKNEEVAISLNSTKPLSLLSVPTLKDIELFAQRSDYESFKSCSIENKKSFTLRCQNEISNGFLIVYNQNLGIINYNISIKLEEMAR